MALPALKRYRKRHRLTQADLGRKLGVSHVTITRWENGRRSPRHTQLLEISKLLGLSMATLVGSARDNSNQEPRRHVSGAMATGKD